MNYAIKKSEGNILCKIDPDDYIDKNFAKEMGYEFNRLNSIFYTLI